MAENLMPEQPQMPTPDGGGEIVEKQEGKQKEKDVMEKEVEQKQTSSSQAQPTVVIPSTKQALPQSESQKSETLEKIEDIMEEDLAEMYASLPDDRKQFFRAKGEETAKEIEAHA